ncbi:MAG: hypothetical protein LBU85_12295 [Treponema sp.]|jgi:hypothetical protein|nr:hypothetical protein [Treponema sp.]
MVQKNILVFIFLFVFAGNVFSQEFGFGFDDDGASGSASPVSDSGLSVKMGGEIAVEMTPYVHDFKKKDNGQAISFWDMASGKLNFTLSGSNVEAYSAFNLNAASVSELWDSPLLSGASYTPLIMDEAFLRAYIGPVNIEAGFRKLAWGKADSLGPLDVTNPLDYTDLRNISDIKAIKIARPMLHLTWNTGNFSKLEAVFIPNFAGHRFAREGRWIPAQYSTMPERIPAGIIDRAIQLHSSYASSIQTMFQQGASALSDLQISVTDTSTLQYFQTGLRYTATIGPVDIGGQYFYGTLFQPDFTVAGVDAFLADLISQLPGSPPTTPTPHTNLLDPQIKYNRYHQIGIDYAQVVWGFNLRSEFAVHITEDLSGDDGSVRNPFIGWSLGFDRELPLGIYANIQCNETIRLLNGKVGNNPVLDCEAGADITSTRITAQFSKKYLRDNLESKVTVIWDIENSGCYVIPAVVWTMGGLTSELSAGVFAGKEDGELGQYWENSFVRVGVKYSF